MFIAVGLDGNRQPVPLAYGFATTETVQSWTWFLSRLKESLANICEVSLLTNVSQSSDRALSLVFPLSYRGYCCLDLLNKLLSRTRLPEHVKTLFWQTCKSSTMSEYQYHLSNLLHAVPHQRQWIESLGFEKWARAFYPNNRFNIYTFNNSDVLDLMRFDHRNLGICDLIETMRQKTEHLWTQRRNYAGTVTKFMYFVHKFLTFH